MRFYVCEQEGDAGKVVDFYDVWMEGTKIDFTRGSGKGKQHVHIVHDEDDWFDLSYS
jgi:hypothetical protein